MNFSQFVSHRWGFSFLIISSLYLNAAINQGTLVNTQVGPIAVEALSPGDAVITIDHKEIRITHVRAFVVETVTVLKIDSGNLLVSDHQQFYEPVLQKWIHARDLRVSNVLVDRKGRYCSVLSVEHIHEHVLMYEISLESPHQFYISEAEILTHNFVPIVVGVTFALGRGISVSGIGMGLGALGLGIWHKIKGSKKIELTQFDMSQKMRQQQNAQNKQSQSAAAGSPPQDPKKDEDDKSPQNKLPKKGDVPFKSKKTKNGKILRDRDGGFIDKHGRSWQWDPKKNEWDVQINGGKRHLNVNPEGKITH